MTRSVLVVGAGPTGLMAAVELARRGHAVTVIEKRDGPSTLSRAVGILQRSIDLMQPSGAGEAIVAEAIAFEAIRAHRGARCIATLPMNFDNRSRLFGLPQDRTEAHLADALARYGSAVRYNAPLQGFVDHGTHVTASFLGAEQQFDYLIGADGKGSAVREALELSYDGYDLPDPWSIADVVVPDWPHPREFCLYLLDGGQMAVVVPLSEQRYRVISSTTDAVAALPVPMAVAQTRRSGTFHIAVRQVSAYGRGRVVLAGDAAHCHSPVGGRGMNLGLADAAELAARMDAGTLGGYSASRHAAGRHVLALSERARRGAQSTSAWETGLNDAVLRLAGAIPPFGRALVRQIANA